MLALVSDSCMSHQWSSIFIFNAGGICGSCSTSVAVTAVVSCAVSFIIGALVGAVVHYCAAKKKCQKFYSLTIALKQQKQQPAPLYEDIVAQKGTVDPSHIELRENIAYGPVQKWLNFISRYIQGCRRGGGGGGGGSFWDSCTLSACYAVHDIVFCRNVQ